MFQNAVSMVSSIAYRRSGTCRNIIALLNNIYDEENAVSMVSSIAYRRSGTCRNIIALLNNIYDEEISHGLQWYITYMCDEEQKLGKEADTVLECRQLELFL
ncbi:hypothetical protein T06_10435 [Trichinella sp. T6]|nr:hypothetical protein T06_10435 [Trichinella sp. T6]